MKYVKRRKVKMTGGDKFVFAAWYGCAMIWMANTYVEVSRHNLVGAGLRFCLILVYLFLPINRYYELKKKQS
jgi:hypothetical protein